MSTPDPVLQQRIEQCQGLVRSLAVAIHRKLPAHVELEDLIAYGQVGLSEAARDFDPQRGSRFSTYAYYRIRGAIYDGLAKMSWFEGPASTRIRCEQLTNDVLRLDSEDHPASDCGSLESEARWFRDVSRTLAIVYLGAVAVCNRGEESDSTPVLVDRSSPDASAEAIRHETTQKLQAVISDLPPMASQLIRAVYFDGMTLEEAGRRLGVSKSWASRLHSRALQQLAQCLKSQGFSA